MPGHRALLCWNYRVGALSGLWIPAAARKTGVGGKRALDSRCENCQGPAWATYEMKRAAGFPLADGGGWGIKGGLDSRCGEKDGGRGTKGTAGFPLREMTGVGGKRGSGFPVWREHGRWIPGRWRGLGIKGVRHLDSRFECGPDGGGWGQKGVWNSGAARHGNRGAGSAGDVWRGIDGGQA